MAETVEEVVSMASAAFPQDVMNAIKNAEFTMEDISQLTRDDIDQEFKNFRFGVRKQLWMFFKSLSSGNCQQHGASTNSTKISSHTSGSSFSVNNSFRTPVIRSSPFEVREVSHSPIGEPNDSSSDSQEAIPSDLDEYSLISTSSVKHEASTSDLNDDSITLTSSASDPLLELGSPMTIPTSYPGDISPPFPLSTSLQEEIKTLDNYTENTLLFHKLVREVYLTLREKMIVPPSKPDLKETAGLLCMEYPSLRGQDESAVWMPLYVALRRRMNRFETGQTSLQRILDEYSSKTVVEVIQTQSQARQQTKHPPLFNIVHHKLQNAIQYPGDIPWPFPLREPMRKFLQGGNDPLADINRRVFKELVREVSGQAKAILGRRPTKSEGKQVVENLCLEYPVLCIDGKTYCPPLRIAITKRYNNLDLKRKKEQQKANETPQDKALKRNKRNSKTGIRLSRPLREWSWRRRDAKLKPEQLLQPQDNIEE